MKVQGNRYINNPEMIKNKVEKKTTVPQNIISEDDVKISDSARKLVETARNKVSDFHTMHFSSINGEIREIPAEYKCENLFKLDLKATSISGEQSAFEGCSENQSEVFEKWLDENASEYLTEDEMKDLKEKINAMTADVDFLNAQEGYRGTSYESVFLLSASEAGLRKVNEMYVPEQLHVGMAAALEESCAHMDGDAAHMSTLRDHLIAGISQIPHSALNGSCDHRLPGNVNFCFEGIEGESLLLLLDDRGICASSGSACTSGSLDPSHVLLAIGRPHEVAHGSLRLSLGKENTMEEMDTIIREVKDVVAYLRKMSPVWRELEKGARNYVIQ